MKRGLLIITGLQCALSLIAGFIIWVAPFTTTPPDKWSSIFQTASAPAKQDAPEPPQSRVLADRAGPTVPPVMATHSQPDPSFHPAEPPLSRLQGLPQ